MAKHSQGIEQLLSSSLFDGEWVCGESLAKHTSYHIGGVARYFVTVHSLHALEDVITTCIVQDVPWTVIGRGTNLLVADDGYPGVVITLGRDFKRFAYDAESHVLSAGAAVSLPSLVQEAFRNSLEGLEFEVGTPGSVGGAVRMNAGSADMYLGSQVLSVTTFSPAFGLRCHMGTDIEWGYRCASFDIDEVVVECSLKLQPADPFYIRNKMEQYLAKRRQSQPLDKPSCGSIFRNPEGISAGALIDGLGLKGLRIGGAMVSDVHANFIVNESNATAHDVRELIAYIQRKAFEEKGITLVPEVRYLGF